MGLPITSIVLCALQFTFHLSSLQPSEGCRDYSDLISPPFGVVSDIVIICLAAKAVMEMVT